MLAMSRRRELRVARNQRPGAGQTAKLCSVGHLLTENRHGMVPDRELAEADGYAERGAAITTVPTP